MSGDHRSNHIRIEERANQLAKEKGISVFLARIQAASEISKEDAQARQARADAMTTHCTET